MADKLPAIHLYPGDWLRDEVSGCSLEAQGLWLRMMFIMHDSDRYGHLSKDGMPIPPGAIARRCGCSLEQYMTLLTELTSAGVPSKTGENIIFSRRMVRDAEVREIHRKAGLLGGRPPSRITKRKPKANQNPEDDNEDVSVVVSKGGAGGVPEDLEAHREDIEKWLAYKRERRESYKPSGLGALWGVLRRIAPEARKVAIENSMGSGYKGIFPPKGDTNGAVKGAKPIAGKYGG